MEFLTAHSGDNALNIIATNNGRGFFAIQDDGHLVLGNYVPGKGIELLQGPNVFGKVKKLIGYDGHELWHSTDQSLPVVFREKPSFGDMPNELVLHILQWLDNTQLVKLRQISRLFDSTVVTKLGSPIFHRDKLVPIHNRVVNTSELLSLQRLYDKDLLLSLHTSFGNDGLDVNQSILRRLASLKIIGLYSHSPTRFKKQTESWQHLQAAEDVSVLSIQVFMVPVNHREVLITCLINIFRIISNLQKLQDLTFESPMLFRLPTLIGPHIRQLFLKGCVIINDIDLPLLQTLELGVCRTSEKARCNSLTTLRLDNCGTFEQERDRHNMNISFSTAPLQKLVVMNTDVCVVTSSIPTLLTLVLTNVNRLNISNAFMETSQLRYLAVTTITADTASFIGEMLQLKSMHMLVVGQPGVWADDLAAQFPSIKVIIHTSDINGIPPEMERLLDQYMESETEQKRNVRSRVREII